MHISITMHHLHSGVQLITSAIGLSKSNSLAQPQTDMPTQENLRRSMPASTSEQTANGTLLASCCDEVSLQVCPASKRRPMPTALHHASAAVAGTARSDKSTQQFHISPIGWHSTSKVMSDNIDKVGRPGGKCRRIHENMPCTVTWPLHASHLRQSVIKMPARHRPSAGLLEQLYAARRIFLAGSRHGQLAAQCDLRSDPGIDECDTA